MRWTDSGSVQQDLSFECFIYEGNPALLLIALHFLNCSMYDNKLFTSISTD